jgi:hypothetical protein
MVTLHVNISTVMNKYQFKIFYDVGFYLCVVQSHKNSSFS